MFRHNATTNSKTLAKLCAALLVLSSTAVVCLGIGGPPPVAEGRMNGGGAFLAPNGAKVTHGFELHCNFQCGPNNLQVNWGPGNRFHMEFMTSGACFDNSLIEPAPPDAPLDTHAGVGFGRLNGVSGARAEWVFTDAGEPGGNDQVALFIWDTDGNLVLDVPVDPPVLLAGGNHQALREIPSCLRTVEGQ